MREINYKPKTGPRNFRGAFDYNYDDNNQTVRISIINEISPSILRELDPWGLAYVKHIESEFKVTVKRIVFEIPEISNNNEIYFNALIRRISFLNINNDNKLSFEVILNNKIIKLFSYDSLFKRPDNEVIRDNIKVRKGGNKSGKTEKDLQIFLFGDSKEKELVPSNKIIRRLGIFGFDFYQLKHPYAIIREFPTGVFKKYVADDTRILPLNYIDFVTFNKKGYLSLIELKINDPKLEVISQTLDYALFFASYYEKLFDLVEKHSCKGHCPEIRKKGFICYVVNNHYHPKFNEIKEYYSTKGKDYNFELKKITLGDTEDF